MVGLGGRSAGRGNRNGASSQASPSSESPLLQWAPTAAPWLALNNVYMGEMLHHHRILLEKSSSPPHNPHTPCSQQASCSICSLNL